MSDRYRDEHAPREPWHRELTDAERREHFRSKIRHVEGPVDDTVLSNADQVRMVHERAEWRRRAEEAEAKVATLQARTQRHERAKNLGQAVEADAATMAALIQRAERAEKERDGLLATIEQLEDNLTERIEEAIVFATKGLTKERDAARGALAEFVRVCDSAPPVQLMGQISEAYKEAKAALEGAGREA